MAHSKRNTSRPIFTSYERQLAKTAWDASTARLSRESFLPFASCSLCLGAARDPVACAAAGDIFCRECALENILTQRRDIRRAARRREHDDRDAADDRARLDAEARDRAVRDFEMLQAGLGGGGGGGATMGTGRGAGGNLKVMGEAAEKERPEDAARNTSLEGGQKEAMEQGPQRGQKRKFSLDEDEVARIVTEERAKARRAIDDEKAAKPKLPSFWTPSVAASSKSAEHLHEIKKQAKSQPVCPASQEHEPHPYSLHTLITIHFTEEEREEGGDKRLQPAAAPGGPEPAGTAAGKTDPPQRICPACKKALTNTSKATMAKPCGHVLCKSCVDKFTRQRPPEGHRHPDEPGGGGSMRCYVCDADLTGTTTKKTKGGGSKDRGKEKMQPGLVELRSEGTGFSAGGTNEVKRSGTAFQC